MARFRDVEDNAREKGFLVPGQETLSMTLLVAAILGDEVAVAQLRDLYEENGMVRSGTIEKSMRQHRKAYRRWPRDEKDKLRADAKAAGVYRRERRTRPVTTKHS